MTGPLLESATVAAAKCWALPVEGRADSWRAWCRAAAAAQAPAVRCLFF
jgi:hypothetical protein